MKAEPPRFCLEISLRARQRVQMDMALLSLSEIFAQIGDAIERGSKS